MISLKEMKGTNMKMPRLSLLRQRAFTLALVLAAIPLTQAQTFTDVHDFTGSEGANPLNGLMIAANGVLYGTASSGGASGNGSIYRISPAGKLAAVYSFKGGSDGSSPESFLIEDKSGNLYGTTYSGGVYGAGTAYRLTGTKETVLYSFGAPSDGSAPEAGLAMDTHGNLYGTTSSGGLYGNGTVFMLYRQAGVVKEKILYNFGTGTDGTVPVAGVTLDASGNLYGTTSTGGAYGYGTVFELTKASGWAETILHNFQDSDDGAVPYAGLVADSSGNFYGAATEGGSQGGGTIYELTPSGSGWNFNVVQSVPGWGISGTFRNVLLDSSGNIYATTHCDGNYNAGTVYELTPADGSWTYTLLYTFTGGTDGLYSFSNLVMRNGSLYGTTNQGGTSGEGVVFAVTP
jgi:uncharacterized repeat protein (TIGR03803 family)